MRRKLNKAGVITKKDSTQNLSIDNNHVSDDDDNNDTILWIKSNTRSVQDIFEKWQLTTSKRLSMLTNGNTQIHEYMDEFQSLKCPDGYRLLEVDCNILYPAAVMRLYSDWPYLSAFVLEKVAFKDKYKYNNCLTSDGKKAHILRMLSSLFPVKNVIMKKKKQWRPSKAEAQDGIIQFVKTAADMQPILNMKKRKFSELCIGLGPQLFAVSLDEDIITDCYLLINNIMYRIESVMKAFDIYFKSFHALNCCYPKEAERELYFLQIAIYNITSNTDKMISDGKTLRLIQAYNKFKPAHTDCDLNVNV